MYIAYILIIDLFDVTPLLILCFEQKGGEECFVFTLTPLLMIDKKGEKYFSIYACFRKRIYVHVGEKELFRFANRRKRIVSCLFMHVYLLIFAYLFYELSLHIYLFIVMHELRGSFLEA